MSMSVNSSSETSAQKRRGEGPDWDKVPFDVGCARCGQDLRGLSDPVCPRCGLTFNWTDAVPIEELTCLRCGYHLFGLDRTRCPECGTDFTWEEVLAEYRRRAKPWFEYQWRRRPVRSLVRTWRTTLRPQRFWSEMDIHDPPRLRPLIGMIALSLMLSLAIWPLGWALADWLWSWRWSAGNTWRRAQWGSWGGLIDRWTAVLNDPTVYSTLACAAVWMLTSLGALLIFRQSMRRYKVRTVHVVRVWVYALAMMLWVAMIVPFLPSLITAVWGFPVDPFLPTYCYLFLVPYVVWSIHHAYKRYLRMRHSLAVGISSQVIGVLGGLAVCDAFTTRNYTASLLQELADWVGLGF